MWKGGPGASGRVLPPVTRRSRVRVAVSSYCTGEGKIWHKHPSSDPHRARALCGTPLKFFDDENHVLLFELGIVSRRSNPRALSIWQSYLFKLSRTISTHITIHIYVWSIYLLQADIDRNVLALNYCITFLNNHYINCSTLNLGYTHLSKTSSTRESLQGIATTLYLYCK